MKNSSDNLKRNVSAFIGRLIIMFFFLFSVVDYSLCSCSDKDIGSMHGIIQGEGESHLQGISHVDDTRYFMNGTLMYGDGTSYIDQPYVVKLSNGRWLCVATIGACESCIDRHICSFWSDDKGKSWSKSIDIEPGEGTQASWVTPYLTNYGRIYIYYNFNGDIVEKNTKAQLFCFKYSDDNGNNWSERYNLPVRLTECDGGKSYFKGWGIDKPKLICGSVFFAYTKTSSPLGGEGWIFTCSNIEIEKNIDKLAWALLPEGEKGIRNEAFGYHQEEHNLVDLNSNSIYCIYRTDNGHLAHSYSHDLGKSWSLPVIATYEPNGTQILKCPRANINMWKCSNGKYLMWFHNHAQAKESNMNHHPQSKKDYPAPNRNPVWITGGIEKDGSMYWSQPEVLLYDDDYEKYTHSGGYTGFSYPDLIEENGKYWITETDKKQARIHSIDPDLFEGMWNQSTNKTLTKTGLVFEKVKVEKGGESIIMPVVPNLKDGGFTIEMLASFDKLDEGQILFDSRTTDKGILVEMGNKNSMRITISDGELSTSWESDGCFLQTKKDYHFAFIVDGGPNIISVVVNGKLCDGGRNNRQGWGRFQTKLEDVNGRNSNAIIAKSKDVDIKQFRFYNRYLRTSEVIANYNSIKL